jgi:uncharacterized protein (TIGR03437 family)
MKKTGKRGALLLPFVCAAVMAGQSAVIWTQQNPKTSPPARVAFGMAYDSAHGEVVLFGGADSGGNLLNDTWVWDGANWTQQNPQTSPPARSSFGMAYDAASGQTVLFGGFGGFASGGTGGAKYLADTWVWDGGNWTEETPQASPQPGSGFAMAYDSGHSQVVLYNGSQTWVWNGANWIEKFPQPTPSASGPMAYDPVHSQAVMFDGLSETWVWDGANWTREFPANTPPAGGALAYDSALGQVVIFGGAIPPASGVGNFTPVNDTWLWNGSNWTEQSPATSPSARSSSALAYDSGHSQVVLFGGATSTVYLADTWTYGVSALPVAGPTISGVVSASAFGGFTSAAPGSWVEIYGSTLGPDTEGWTGAEFTNGLAPTSLNGVSVSIGGQAAFVDYISATQVNAQLPSNIATGGTLQLTVTNANGTSAPVNITVNTTEPGLLAPALFKIGSNQYVVAQFSDGTYVLPTGAIAGVDSRPAKPGETVVIYGVGFGSVTPNIPAGEIVTEANRLSASFEVLFGKTPAQLPYFGLAPSFVGLYQFNVTVPAVADNDLVPLTFNLGGASGTQILYTAVHQ